METICTIEELKNAIRLAENKQSDSAKMLREQLHVTLASLKSGNLLVKTLKDAVSVPGLGKTVAEVVIAISTSTLLQKVLAGTATMVLRKIFDMTKFSRTMSFSKHTGRSLEQAESK